MMMLTFAFAAVSLCTAAERIDLQQQIDAAAAKGGGRVVVPVGTWRTGPVHLKSGVELHLSDGAILDFLTDPADYLPKVRTSWQGEEMSGLSPLVYAYGATNVAITGKGTFRTENGPWKKWFKEGQGRRRPQFFQFFLCKDIRLEDFAVRGSPFWTIHLYRSEDAVLKGLDVSAFDSTGLAMMNSDGVDVECSRRVRVSRCKFHQGDDAIVIKSGRDEDGIRRGLPSEDVLIEDCVVTEGHVLLGIGSEIGGGVRNVTMRRCRAPGSVHNLVYLKTNAKRGGFMRNITVEDVEANKVRRAVVGLTANYWYTPKPGTPNLHRTEIEGITVRNVRVTEAASGIDLCGDPERPARAVTIENVKVAKVTRQTFNAVNVLGLKVSGLDIAEGPVATDTPHVGGQEGDPPAPKFSGTLSGETRVIAKTCGDIVQQVGADLSQPVLSGEGVSLWEAQLAEVRRLDEAADARWAACRKPDEIKALQDELKTKMTRAIGGFPERVSLNAVVADVVPRDGYRIEKVYFESQPKFYETGLFFRPDGDGPFPAVAVACGHSGNGKGALGYQRACVLAAKAGIAAFIYDPVDQGERTQLVEKGGNVHGHNRIGIRAALLGWSMARFRVWDAMRAVDYLASRADVDAQRLGFMGNSGGGTLTSLTMALDGRLRAAAPSCYLTTLRHVCEDCGPQDAEQNIFGQLDFGLNHLGYVAMRAPKATLMVCKTKDFFPIRGSLATQKIAEGVYAAAGDAAAYDLFAAPGGHGWVESTRSASVAWMRRWLKNETAAFNRDLVPDFLAKDQGFAVTNVDCGLSAGYEVSPKGNVRNLPGAVTAYDILRREAERQASARMPMTPEKVRTIAGLRRVNELPEPQVVKGAKKAQDGYTSTTWRIDLGGGVALAAVALRPEGESRGAPVLMLPSGDRASAAAKVVELLSQHRTVLVADVRGMGESCRNAHRFYGSDYPEEGIAAMAYLTGRNLVAERAEDILVLARLWAKDNGQLAVEAISLGRTAIPLAHATAVARDLFAKRTYVDAPPAWRDWFTNDSATVHYADLVNGAYGAYDWIDL